MAQRQTGLEQERLHVLERTKGCGMDVVRHRPHARNLKLMREMLAVI